MDKRKKQTNEHKRKISEAVKKYHKENPRVPIWLFTKKSRKKASITKIGHKNTPEGKKHFNWKGEKAGYGAKHDWIRLHFGKADRCEEPTCKYPRKNWDGELMLKPKRYEWANISKEYKRQRDDWEMLCPSCHRTKDIKNS